MAGVPFDRMEDLCTPGITAAARTLLVRQAEFERAKAAVELLLQTRGHGGLSEELFRAWRKAIRSGTLPPVTDQTSGAFAVCWESARQLALAESVLKEVMQAECGRARGCLIEASRKLLPAYLLFGAEGVRGLFARQLADYPSNLNMIAPRNNSARKVEQSLILYLQRVAAKNDTFSQFGPSLWGKAEDEVVGLKFVSDLAIARRELFFERWTAHALAAVMNADPEIFAELKPRVNPNGRLENGSFVFTDSGLTQSLSENEIETLRRCDGETPATSLSDLEVLRGLIEKKIVLCLVEVPALEPRAFDVLLGDVENWEPTSEREKWLSFLKPLADLPDKFGAAATTDEREQVLGEARMRLDLAGASAKSGQRSLYSAINVIGEECARAGAFSISPKLLNEVASEASLWIDLWRDSYAYVAHRVAAGLRIIFETASAGNTAVPLPRFLQACESSQQSLTGPGLVSLAARAFQDVKKAFIEQLQQYPDREEHQLSADDCHVVRNTFAYPKFDQYTYPSADLQIAAESTQAVAGGRYQWILSELHPPVALLHHGFYWSCPDKALLNQAFASTTLGCPNFHFGFFAADFTSHTTVRLFDALAGLTTFVAPQRGNSKWPTVRPADAEVYLEPSSGDVAVRAVETQKHLGSFARAWVIPLGFHPFHFGRAPHMPRLRCGKVIVQRESWTVSAGEFPPGNFNGISRDLVLAVERLRASRNWPRHIYIRPTEQSLRRSGAEGRDKDTKPVFIDLESYLSLEIFHRWLTKSGELEVTEMLPDPDHLCWQEADGRRTFELRTLIVPR